MELMDSKHFIHMFDHLPPLSGVVLKKINIFFKIKTSKFTLLEGENNQR